jgi:cell shape-determining protein MreC
MSYERKESFEQKRKRLASVKVWVNNFLDANQKNNNILEMFEKNAELDLAKTINTNVIDPNAEPINILVIGK